MNTTSNLREIYKHIPKTENYYASESGKIYKKIGSNFIKVAENYDSKFYLRATVKVEGRINSIYSHQLVAMAFHGHMPCGNGLVIDHINSDKSDNRPVNLRVVTQRFNISKERVAIGKSRYTGVTWSKRDKKWQSQIGFRKSKIYLGSFVSEEEAAKKYQDSLQLIIKVENILRKSS